MTRVVLLLTLVLGPLTAAAQDSDGLIPLELVTEASSVALAADEADDGTITCGGDCLGSEEDQTACYVVAGIATAAFGAAAIVGLVREGNPCAYIGWGDCGECKDPDRTDTAADVSPAPRRGVGIIPAPR